MARERVAAVEANSSSEGGLDDAVREYGDNAMAALSYRTPNGSVRGTETKSEAAAPGRASEMV